MRALSLALLICSWCISEAPAVLAGTRATIDDSAQFEVERCMGRDGNWYLPGAKECQPPEEKQPLVPSEAADTQEATGAARTSEAPTSPRHSLFLAAAAAAVISLAAIVIATVFGTTRRASKSTPKPDAQPPDTAALRRSVQRQIKHPPPPVAPANLSPPHSAPPTPPPLAEQTPAPTVMPVPAPPSGESAEVRDQPAGDEGQARLVTVWTGPPCTVEFTHKDQDGDWHRNTVDITRIMRDPRDGGWHLHGFCHLWQEERDYDGASIVTKILYKRRRWNLEDWIAAVAGREARDP
jgi:hypothetical protein